MLTWPSVLQSPQIRTRPWKESLQHIHMWRRLTSQMLFLSTINAKTMSCSSKETTTTNHLMALFPGQPRWASTRKVKPVWILLKQETESGSGISWAICKSAPCSRQITMPAPHHSVFYRPDALPDTQPTASKHWRHKSKEMSKETHTHPFNGPLSRTTWVSQYQKGTTNLDFTEARDSEWQWQQLGHMQVCTSLHPDR